MAGYWGVEDCICPGGVKIGLNTIKTKGFKGIRGRIVQTKSVENDPIQGVYTLLYSTLLYSITSPSNQKYLEDTSGWGHM